MTNYVYWIYDTTCKDPLTDGYIGVSHDVYKRHKTHIRKKRVPEDSSYKILFEGTRQECFLFEKQMRPTKKIGWNNAVGGSHGWKTGFEHSVQTKQILKERWTQERRAKASLFKTEQNKKMTGQKRPKQSEAMKGSKNPNYGKERPEHVKQAVRLAHTGKQSSNRQENYCIGCHERCSISIIKKYHTKCFKLFCERIINE